MTAVNSTTTTALTGQTTATVEVTVRVTGNTPGTLLEAAATELQSIPDVVAVTVDENTGIMPRNGKTLVTVIADITVSGASMSDEVVETVDAAVCIDDVQCR